MGVARSPLPRAGGPSGESPTHTSICNAVVHLSVLSVNIRSFVKNTTELEGRIKLMSVRPFFYRKDPLLIMFGNFTFQNRHML